MKVYFSLDEAKMDEMMFRGVNCDLHVEDKSPDIDCIIICVNEFSITIDRDEHNVVRVIVNDNAKQDGKTFTLGNNDD